MRTSDRRPGANSATMSTVRPPFSPPSMSSGPSPSTSNGSKSADSTLGKSGSVRFSVDDVAAGAMGGDNDTNEGRVAHFAGIRACGIGRGGRAPVVAPANETSKRRMGAGNVADDDDDDDDDDDLRRESFGVRFNIDDVAAGAVGDYNNDTNDGSVVRFGSPSRPRGRGDDDDDDDGDYAALEVDEDGHPRIAVVSGTSRLSPSKKEGAPPSPAARLPGVLRHSTSLPFPSSTTMAATPTCVVGGGARRSSDPTSVPKSGDIRRSVPRSDMAQSRRTVKRLSLSLSRSMSRASSDGEDDGGDNAAENTTFPSALPSLAADTFGPPLSKDGLRLSHALADAVEEMHGVSAAEVWVLDEDETGRLERPEGGWWRDPRHLDLGAGSGAGAGADAKATAEKEEALRSLEDPSYPTYVPPDPVAPGVDLAGRLWAEVSSPSTFHFGSHFGFNAGLPTPPGSLKGGNFFGNLSNRGGNLFGNLSNRGENRFGRSGHRRHFSHGGGVADRANDSGGGGCGDASNSGGKFFANLSHRGGNFFDKLISGPSNLSGPGGNLFGSSRGGTVFGGRAKPNPPPSSPSTKGIDMMGHSKTKLGVRGASVSPENSARGGIAFKPKEKGSAAFDDKDRNEDSGIEGPNDAFADDDVEIALGSGRPNIHFAPGGHGDVVAETLSYPSRERSRPDFSRKTSSALTDDTEPAANLLRQAASALSSPEKAKGAADREKPSSILASSRPLPSKNSHRRAASAGNFPFSSTSYSSPSPVVTLDSSRVIPRADWGGGQGGSGGGSVAIIWCDLPSLLLDPDAPTTARMAMLRQAGWVQAAACPFQTTSGIQGVVIYLATADTDADRLTEASNQVLMVRSAEWVGSTVAVMEARRARMALRWREERERREKLQQSGGGGAGEGGRPDGAAGVAPGDYRGDMMQEKISETVRPSDKVGNFRRRLRVWSTKCRGGGGAVPVLPRMSSAQSLWTFAGAFSGLFILSGLGQLVHILTDGNFSPGPYLPPMGALMALQYGLTAAPASQPRNALLGQALAGIIALLFTYVPDNVLPPWIRMALAPGVAIAATVRAGVVHPPAGAAAVLLSTGAHGWKLYGLLLASTVLSFLPAVTINNLSLKRHYPTHWALLPPGWAAVGYSCVGQIPCRGRSTTEGETK